MRRSKEVRHSVVEGLKVEATPEKAPTIQRKTMKERKSQSWDLPLFFWQERLGFLTRSMILFILDTCAHLCGTLISCRDDGFERSGGSFVSSSFKRSPEAR